MRLRQQRSFRFHRREGKKIISHNVGERQMRGGRNQIADEERLLAVRLDQNRLMMFGVTGGSNHRDPLQNLRISLQEIEPSFFREDLVILQQITAAGSLVGGVGEFPFPFLNEVGCSWKGRMDAAVVVSLCVSAGVVEVKVGVDNERDVGRSEAALCERFFDRRSALHGVDLVELLIPLVSDSGIDEDVHPVRLDEESAELQMNPVPVVGGMMFFPEYFRDDAEHGAAVEAEGAVGERFDFKGAELHNNFHYIWL